MRARRRRPDDARRRGPDAERTVYVYVFYRSDRTRARALRAVRADVRWCDDDDASGATSGTTRRGGPKVTVDIAF